MIDVDGMTTEERDEALGRDFEQLGTALHGIADRMVERLANMADVVADEGLEGLESDVVHLLAEAARLGWKAEEITSMKRLSPSVTSLAAVQGERRSAAS